VYLNPNSGGSAIDPQFLENQKTAENSLSFELYNVCYFKKNSFTKRN
jgi:hypothetical protein